MDDLHTAPIKLTCAFFSTLLMVESHAGLAATILSIHSDQDKVIVSLSQEEMAAIILKVETPLEIQTTQETYFTHGTPRNLNPLRKTVVVQLTEPDDRIKPKHKVKFLPKIHNAIFAPVLQAPSQLYQYLTPLAAGGLGILYDSNKVTGADRFVTTQATGYTSSFQGFFGFSPGFIDGSLGFYASDSQIKKTDTPVDASQPIVTTRDRFETTKLEPGIMWTIDGTYSLGFRYDWSALKSRQSSSDQTLTYNYTFAEPVVSLTARSARSEKTIRYKGQDSSQGTLANRSVKATQVKPETTTLPASLEVSYRYLAPQRLAWSFSLGYLMASSQKPAETDQTPAKGKPAEKVLWQSILEHRLDQGDRLDYVLAYRGSEGRGLSRITQGTNTLRMGLHITRPYSDGWSLGAGAYGEGGSFSSGGTDKTTSFAGLFLLNLQKEFPAPRQKRSARPL